MEEQILKRAEALIFASEQALEEAEIQNILTVALDFPVEIEQVSQAIEQLMEKYEGEEYPFHIVKSGGGYQFLTKSAYHETISTLNKDKFNKRLSATSMETLSIIAYRQPVTKGEIEFIRGVSSDYSIQKLLEKELIYIQGRKEDAIGKPLLYATTKYLLDYLGINNPSELPKLKEIVAIESIVPTDAANAQPIEVEHSSANALAS